MDYAFVLVAWLARAKPFVFTQRLVGRVETLTRLPERTGFVRFLHCAAFKKVRDDNGYWSQIETYISAHSDADFSHSICPQCVTSLYPQLEAATRNDT